MEYRDHQGTAYGAALKVNGVREPPNKRASQFPIHDRKLQRSFVNSVKNRIDFVHEFCTESWLLMLVPLRCLKNIDARVNADAQH